jgi:UPF0755 protein
MSFFRRYKTESVVIFSVLFLAGFLFAFSPPRNFPAGKMLSVTRGVSVSEIAKELADAHIIAHPQLLRAILRVSGESSHVQAGIYLFNTPESLLTIAYRLVTGAYDLPPVHITFVEGTTVREMAIEVANGFPLISAENFLSEGQSYEGYLFPDTYFFSPSSDAASIVAVMRANFNAKIAALSDEIHASGRSLSDTVILASLIEKEARTSVNRRIVAGVLLNRLKLGMPLQVDAVFGYIFGRDTYSPSFADLTVSSPYNTYTHTGLPPGPIDNPGLDSLGAVANPTKTDFLYYLTDKNGVMHYATTYAAHQANQKKYLN